VIDLASVNPLAGYNPQVGRKENRSVASLALVGGRLCLDFVNTVSWRDGPCPVDWLRDYDALVAFCRRSGVAERAVLDELQARARRHPKEAAEGLSRALSLREAIHRVMIDHKNRRSPDRAALGAINEELGSAPARTRLELRDGRLNWVETKGKASLHRIVWPIIWSAAELLTSEPPLRPKVCAGDGCGWLFLDESRASSRRWCSMTDCGNRAKARRHYRRTRGE
jgi:predicted RNA-binding Zn ribbon-like protein